MVCIYCWSPTKVINSRHKRQTNSIWRRRQCLSCNAIFTTKEYPDLSSSLMVLGPGEREPVPLNRDQLFLSIYASCRHRPAAMNEASHLTRTILDKLLEPPHEAIIPRERIVTTALSVLKRFDKAAATAYKAYHP